MSLRDVNNGFRKKLAAAMIIIAGIGLTADLGLQNFLNRKHHQDQVADVTLKMAQIRARLEEKLVSCLILINGMSDYISVNPDLTENEFQAMASKLMAHSSLLKNMAAAPNFIISYVYPLQGNENILGKNYRDLPGQWQKAKLAMETGQTVVAGPLKLIQGGNGLVGRDPVFTGQKDNQQFWGLVSGIIDTDRLITDAGMSEQDSGLLLALRVAGSPDTPAEPFQGSADLFDPAANSVHMEVTAANASWQMAGIPVTGWDTSNKDAWIIHVNAGMLACLAFLIAFIRLKDESQLRQTRQTLSEAQSVARLGSLEWDLTSDSISWSNEVYGIFEIDRASMDLTRETYLSLTHPDDRPMAIAALKKAVREKTNYDIDHRILFPDGRIKHIHALGRISCDPYGRPAGVIGTIQDVSDKVAAETALRENREMLRSMSEAAYDAIIMIEADDTIQFWNRAAEAMFGYSSDEAVGRKLHDLIVPDAEERRLAATGLQHFAGTGKGAVLNSVTEFTAMRRDGSLFPVERSVGAFSSGKRWLAVGSLRDITERREAQAKLEKLATIDSLTGLYNRRHFTDLATRQIVQAVRYGQPLSLIMFDVDHFKAVNDSFGHATGDMVLEKLARITRDVLRQADISGRLGGEEFAACLPETGIDGAENLAERLRMSIAMEIMDSPGGTLSVTISLGVTEMVTGGENLDAILKRADNALYRAKDTGRNRVVIAVGNDSEIAPE